MALQPVAEVCVGEIGFSAFETSVEGDEANEFCQEQGTLELAPIRNLQQLTAVTTALQEAGVAGDQFLIGLRRLRNGRSGFNFQFTDNEDINDPDLVGFIHVDDGVFPWAADEPDNNPGCVGLRNGLFFDENCGANRNVLCLIECVINEENDNENENNENGLDIALVGGAVGAIFAFLAFSVLIIFALRRKKKPKVELDFEGVTNQKDDFVRDRNMNTMELSPAAIGTPVRSLPSSTGKNSTPNIRFGGQGWESPGSARPNSSYLKKIENNPDRESIFRPSSTYLKNSSKKQKSKQNQKKENFNIDEDI